MRLSSSAFINLQLKKSRLNSCFWRLDHRQHRPVIYIEKEKLRKTSELLKLSYGKHFPDGDNADHSDFTERRRQTLEFGVPNQLKFSEQVSENYVTALEHFREALVKY